MKKAVTGAAVGGAVQATVEKAFTRVSEESVVPEPPPSSSSIAPAATHEEEFDFVAHARAGNEADVRSRQFLDESALEPYFAGEALEYFRRNVRSLRESGRTEECKLLEMRPEPVERNGDQARMKVSELWATVVTDQSSGSRTLIPPKWVPQTVYFAKSEDGWRIVRVEFEDDLANLPAGEFPELRSRYLAYREVSAMDEPQVQARINEMYAVRGYCNDRIQGMFGDRMWFRPNPALTDQEDVTQTFGAKERENLRTLVFRRSELRRAAGRPDSTRGYGY